jgi:hypothetical protein
MKRGFAGIGAFILARNMFGPVRGPWPDDAWRGWWGDNPPYHRPVFVLTRHARAPVTMKGGTEFHFVNGIQRALEQATEAAAGQDIRLGGGVSAIRRRDSRCSPEPRRTGIARCISSTSRDLPALDYECVEHSPQEAKGFKQVTRT